MMESNERKFDSAGTHQPGDDKAPMSAGLIGILIVLGLFVLFFLQNGDTVHFHFLTFNHETTMRWSLIVAVVLGILLDRIFSIVWRRRQRRNRNSS